MAQSFFNTSNPCPCLIVLLPSLPFPQQPLHHLQLWLADGTTDPSCEHGPHLFTLFEASGSFLLVGKVRTRLMPTQREKNDNKSEYNKALTNHNSWGNKGWLRWHYLPATSCEWVDSATSIILWRWATASGWKWLGKEDEAPLISVSFRHQASSWLVTTVFSYPWSMTWDL